MPFRRKGRKSFRRKRKPRKGQMMLTNRETMTLGRNFPPTVLRWTAENIFNRRWTTRSLSGVAYNLMSVGNDPDGSGIIEYASADGTIDVPTAKQPRNWALLAPLYLRARCLGCSVSVTITFPSIEALNISWNVYWWISSELDQDNPVKQLVGTKTVGTAPYEVDETKEKSLRTILDSSRRVLRARVRSSQNRSTYTIKARLPMIVDRVGNRVVGGNLARVVVNAPGGTALATDKPMATALTDSTGVQSRLNIVCVPTKPATTTGFNVEATQVKLFNHMEFYDRVLPSVT